MANITSGNVVTIKTINDVFTETVVDVILNNAYDINNAPVDKYSGKTYKCIQDGRLGDKNDLPVVNAGISGTIVTAMELYNNLVSMTTILTRVGTFTYVRRYRSSNDGVDSYTTQKTVKGKALFNDSYIKTLKSFTNPVTSNSIISADTINTLIANLLTAWKDTNRHANSKTVTLCHTDCHTDCHNDCNANDDCYK